jgi:ubiquinone/menaquinone biosynthesis C-methylase UbiE
MKCAPPRATTTELIDLFDQPITTITTNDPDDLHDLHDLHTNLADIRDVNRWLGGTQSVIRAIDTLCSTMRNNPHTRPSPSSDHHGHHTMTLLDVATGSADIPLAVQTWAARRHISLQAVASDIVPAIVYEARRVTKGHIPLLCHDALAMPFADNSFDIVTCAQTLHHLDPPAAAALLQELARVARFGVVVSDLRRSWGAYWGALLLRAVQRSPMSRHDGPLSVLRAYTLSEAQQVVQQAGVSGRVQRDGPFRLTIVCAPNRDYRPPNAPLSPSGTTSH